MNLFKPTLTAVAAVLALAAAAPALAQANPLDELREEVRKLRAELEALKKDRAATPAVKPADASGWGERIEQLELKSKDAVTLGDIGGGFRLPGSETSIRLYGYAEAHAIHDIKVWSGSDNFTDLTFQGATGAKGRTKFTAETSRFGFETSTPTAQGTFNTKLEMDFYAYSNGNGNRNRLRLRHAYGEYAGFLVGQTWSTFMDLDNLPETVDFNGPIGAPFSRRTMVRYTYGMPQDGMKFTVAMEDPEDQFGGGSANERMPQLVARFDKSFDWGAVNLRGLAHEKRSDTQTKRGYGFGVGGSYKLTDKDLLMGQYTQVDGDFDQLYGSNAYAIDATDGKITFDRNRGLVLGYAKTFSDQLRGTLAFGMNKGRVEAAVDNRRLTQWHLNLIYSPIKNVELGGELVLGERKTFAGDVAKMQRVDLMGRYSF
ncbi:DcaP family trimeric outer membrane transporter [Ideonella sp. DXS22W]|uniref:DcaP family trimeric outer membrane transporter n=1 Tax=Pseudaquabacterium inlustre TaxID=2984192 RepID=A0ABU9CDU3_9BURK